MILIHYTNVCFTLGVITDYINHFTLGVITDRKGLTFDFLKKFIL